MQIGKNDNIYLLKGIAIISVVFAHCHNLSNSNMVDKILNVIAVDIGTIGVPIFLLCSGYLFKRVPIKDFFIKKTSLLISWICTGTLIWLYEVIRKGLGYAKWYEWILGIGTYLWYMPTIFIIWLIYEIVQEKYYRIVFALVVILCLLVFPICGIMLQGWGGVIDNVMRFLPFYHVGYELKKCKMDVKGKNKFIVISLLVIGGGLLINHGQLFYGCILFYSIELSAALLTYRIISTFGKEWVITKIIRNLGVDSYSIYLLHMPLAGVFANIFSRAYIGRLLVLVYPIIVCMAMGFFCFCCKRIIKNRAFLKLIGL